MAVLALPLMACSSSGGDSRKTDSSSSDVASSSSSATTASVGAGGDAANGSANVGGGVGGTGGAAVGSSSSALSATVATSVSSTGSGMPACVPLPVGSSTDCYQFGSQVVVGQQGGAPCTLPSDYMYMIDCTDDGPPEGWTDCYMLDNFSAGGTVFCAHDECVQRDADDAYCAQFGTTTPNGWRCETDTSALPPGCSMSNGVWCCP